MIALRIHLDACYRLVLEAMELEHIDQRPQQANYVGEDTPEDRNESRQLRDSTWDARGHCPDCDPALFPHECEGHHHFALRFGQEHLHTIIDGCLPPGYVVEMLAGAQGEVFYLAGQYLGCDDPAENCWEHGSRLRYRLVGDVRIRSTRIKRPLRRAP